MKIRFPYYNGYTEYEALEYIRKNHLNYDKDRRFIKNSDEYIVYQKGKRDPRKHIIGCGETINEALKEFLGVFD